MSKKFEVYKSRFILKLFGNDTEKDLEPSKAVSFSNLIFKINTKLRTRFSLLKEQFSSTIHYARIE